MVPRALLGSLERFFGVLIEHHGGAFPLWLAPVQVIILPISDKHLEYSKKIEAIFRKNGIRVQTDSRSDKINYKVRAAQLQKIPFMVILGDEEEKNQKITVRKKSGENLTGIEIEAFISGQEWRK